MREAAIRCPYASPADPRHTVSGDSVGETADWPVRCDGTMAVPLSGQGQPLHTEHRCVRSSSTTELSCSIRCGLHDARQAAASEEANHTSLPFPHHDSGDRFGRIDSSGTGWMREVIRAQQVTDPRCMIQSPWKCRVDFAHIMLLDYLIAVGRVRRLRVGTCQSLPTQSVPPSLNFFTSRRSLS